MLPKRRSQARYSSHKEGFSLIELLVVIAIIGVVVGLGASAFSGGGRNQQLAGSAAQISGMLSGARDLAISSNRVTRFFFVTGESSNPEELKMRGYGVLQSTPPNAEAERQFSLVTELRTLGAGLYFAKDSGTAAAGASDAPATDEQGVVDRKITENVRGTELEYTYIEFLPTGGTVSSSSANIFLLQPGTGPEQPLPNSANYARFGVSKHTGRVKMERP